VKVLTEKGIPVLSLHGGLSTVQRQKVLSDFQNAQQGTVLVMTLKTGGVGLNLTQASYVFHLEPWWNPAVENQATDRAHRLGQSKAVQVYRYIMHESLEEKIETLKIQKNEKFKALFQDFESDVVGLQTQGKLSREDFNYLLGLSHKLSDQE
jgi:SNF2 family DNA or RNA helicase